MNKLQNKNKLKTNIFIAILLIALFLATIFVIRFWSPEDTWLCQNGAWVKHGNPNQSQPIISCGTSKACTEEAKICPDGSAVGRTGSNCEFSPCPE